MIKKALLAAAMLAAGLAIGLPIARMDAAAQQATQPTIKRTILQRFDVPDSKYEVVLGVAEIPPNTTIGRHFHFGSEMGTLVEGDATLYVDGKAEQVMKPGDSYLVPEKVVHDAKSGPKGAKVMAVYTVLKGQPFATPAPAK